MTKKTTLKTRGHGKFPIVAIGASEGGLEAVSELLKNLPSKTGMAYVYIQHLDPTHKSMLSDILARTTKMKVLEAKHLLKIVPDHLYIIPPNRDMNITNGTLTLNQRKAKPNVHMPIDQFFFSLAEKQKEHSVGIVLSGNAHDGTLGLKAIKTAGGFTFAQDESAKFQSMPKSAISEGVVDMVLSPKDIAKELERISYFPEMIKKTIQETEEFSSVDKELPGIFQLLKKTTGVDFSHYKVNTIKRRIIRRMLLHKLKTIKEYSQYLKKHKNEVTLLCQDLLINVTRFFRDPDTIEFLKKTLFPRILRNKKHDEPLRIWIPACATGEEAYSIAITFSEVLGDLALENKIQIFATDLSEKSIARARLGLYSINDLADISPKKLQRYFTKVDGSYRVIKPIRDICIFAQHNIFTNPPFSRIDLVSCCNLMIYLDPVLQKKLLSIFHYSLNNDGFLVLGKSETTGNTGQLFSQVEKKYKVYSKKKGTNDKVILELNYQPPVANNKTGTVSRKVLKTDFRNETSLDKRVDNILLEKYLPASVVVNQDLEILQFRGSTGLFLEPSPGKASLNLLKMARPGFAFELQNAVRKSNKSGEKVKKSGLEIKSKGSTHSVSIDVVPLEQDGEDKLFLIVFEEIKPPRTADKKSSFSKDRLVKQLRTELASINDDLRSVIEERESSIEELQSANEEIVSSNEELESINEELETSKEELESTNEELNTINSELEMRNEQLLESQEYSAALLDTIRGSVLVLDKNFRIKMANKPFYKAFQIEEKEIRGMLLFELGNGQWNILKLRELLEQIIPRNTNFYDFEVEHNFPVIGQKIMLLNGRRIVQEKHNEQLILLAIEDVTEYRRAEQIIAEREKLFREMADNAPVMIWVAGPDNQRTFFNKTWLAYTGRTLRQEIGNGWMENINKVDLQRFMEVYNRAFNIQEPFRVEYRLRRYDGEYRWILSVGKPTYSPEGVFTGFLGPCTEIHDQRLINEELEKRVQLRTHELQDKNEELERSNNELQQFAYVASHDLQEPLRKIIAFSDRLGHFKEAFPEKGQNYVDKIMQAAERMTRLIDDLLNFSRTSRRTEKFKRIDLNKLLENVLVDFDEIINQKIATIHQDKLPTVEAIPVQIEQLFHNILSNAFKFTKKDIPPVISISLNKLTPEQTREMNLNTATDYIEIIFRDNGIGFNPEFREQIFVIFKRLNDREQYPGTGIGLALCRKIVNNHGGKMYVESEENDGAAFHVILPIKQLINS